MSVMLFEQQLQSSLWQAVFQRLELSLGDMEPLLKFAKEKQYPRKTSLVSSGESWDKLYFIKRGVLRMFYVDLQGRDFNKAFFADGQCIWPVAPIDRLRPIKFNIATIEKTNAIELPVGRLVEFLQQYGKWEQFALPFAEKLVESKFRREHDFLLLSAAQRYENFCLEHPALVDRIPDYHLASLLGITNVSLSRIKNATPQ